MPTNPYQSPESQTDHVTAVRPRKFGYFQVSLGYVLLAVYVFVARYIAQLVNSTGQFDRTLALEYSLWLVPFVVLVPALSWLAFRSGNQEKDRLYAAILFFVFLICTLLIVLAAVELVNGEV